MAAARARAGRGERPAGGRRLDPGAAGRAAPIVRPRRHGRAGRVAPPLALRRALTKRELRVAAVDDGAFTRRHRFAPLVAVSAVAPGRLDAVAIGRLRVDGLDVTERILDLIEATGQVEGLRLLVLDGIAFGGFNLVDLTALSRRSGLPVLAVTPRAPDLPAIRSALRRYFPRDYRVRWGRIRRAPLDRFEGPGGPLWVARAGVRRELVRPLLRRLVARGRWPEVLSIAHRIARAVRPPGSPPARRT